MARPAIQTWYFVLVVVRHEDRFLLVHERIGAQPWYLPAGRVEAGERFTEAAIRETLEESGVRVVVERLVRIEHMPHANGTARLRVIFMARPEGDPTPRTTPNDDTLGARWVTLAEMTELPLRGPEVRQICEHIASRGVTYPLDLVTGEGEPYPG